MTDTTAGRCYPQDRPCPTCPWWLDNPTDGSRIPRFRLDYMLGLANTVGPGDALRRIMACHASPVGRDFPCVGYVARHGLSNLALRITASQGRIDLIGIVEGCADLPLYDTFWDMLAAYLATIPLDPQEHDTWTRTCAADAVDAPPAKETPCP